MQRHIYTHTMHTHKYTDNTNTWLRSYIYELVPYGNYLKLLFVTAATRQWNVKFHFKNLFIFSVLVSCSLLMVAKAK